MNINWTWFGVLAFLVDWLIRIGFLLYIPRKRKPSSAIAWLLVIFLLPGLGIVLFLLIGSPKLSKRRRALQNNVDKLMEQAGKEIKSDVSSLSPDRRQRVEPIVKLSKALGKLPAKAGNGVKILPEYNQAVDDIVKHINSAKEFVHLEYFILALDGTTQPLFDAMENAVNRGVKVRLLIDGMGHRAYPRRKEMKKLLTSIGVDWHLMLPVRILPKHYNRPDLRNHRKIVVIDDSTAYIGSQNLVDRTYHRKDDIYYDELVARLSGPIVRQCSVIFACDWMAETGEKLTNTVNPKKRPLPEKTGDVLAQILPSGPGYDTENNARLFAQLIHSSREKVVITNPYFVPNDAILEAVTSAARRGVDISIINSEAMDQWMVGHAQRSYYLELLSSGVKIYLHKKPVLLHSKHMTIDNDIAVIGSSNMDIRSFELDLECILITYSNSVVSDLRKVQKIDLSNSKQVNLSKWKKRGLKSELLDSVARLTAALQ